MVVYGGSVGKGVGAGVGDGVGGGPGVAVGGGVDVGGGGSVGEGVPVGDGVDVGVAVGCGVEVGHGSGETELQASQPFPGPAKKSELDAVRCPGVRLAPMNAISSMIPSRSAAPPEGECPK